VVTQAYEALAWHRDRFGARRDEYALPSRIYLDAAAGYSPADYERARQVRQVALAEAAELFRHVDVVLAPTTTTPAPALAALDPYDLGSAGCFHTRYWSLLGYPALAVPIGFTRAGLPLGMQLIGPPFADGRVLSVGRLFQMLTDWHDRSPAGL
jgi:aspartyl-tRNA(Asn)/glutamyl-tRNA(Gln) amidotransferase subunit A